MDIRINIIYGLLVRFTDNFSLSQALQNQLQILASSQQQDSPTVTTTQSQVHHPQQQQPPPLTATTQEEDITSPGGSTSLLANSLAAALGLNLQNLQNSPQMMMVSPDPARGSHSLIPRLPPAFRRLQYGIKRS